MDFPELTEARVVTIQPGDVVALRSAAPLSREVVSLIQQQASAAFGCPVVVLDGLELDVLRQEG